MNSDISEANHYFPILITLKASGGKAELDNMRETVASLIRADFRYLNTPSGPKTQESQFEKDFNWAGKRLVDAGLIEKLRTHWALTVKAMEMDVNDLLRHSRNVR